MQVRSPWYFPSVAEHSAVLDAAGFRVSRMEHFARPTPLSDCANGVADWLRMFGGKLLEQFPAAERDDAVREATARTAGTLRTADGWYVDYWRLRFVAEKPS